MEIATAWLAARMMSSPRIPLQFTESAEQLRTGERRTHPSSLFLKSCTLALYGPSQANILITLMPSSISEIALIRLSVKTIDF